MAEVWFAIPSASVDRCRARLPLWRELGYRVAVLQNQERGDIPADICVWSDHYPGWAESVNTLCRDIVPRSADIVVSGGDDMLPDPDRTADQLASEYFERFPDGFGVMQPAGDTFMWAENYCGSPWFGRAFFESMYGGRGPMFGGYRHNWADYELYWVARCLGVLWMRSDARQHHAHFTREGEATPEWWQRNVAAADRKDCELFLARKYRFFPGHEPEGRTVPFDQQELLRHETGVAEWKWSNAYAPRMVAQTAAERLRAGFEKALAAGARRVAIYGAGTHTRHAAHALAEPPIEVVAILDDARERRGQRLFGFPIVSPDEAAELGVDAVILSSDSFEDKLWTNSASLREEGLRVIRLYEDKFKIDDIASPKQEVAA